MPSYKDLLKLLREGKSPKEIMSLLSLRPSRLRRMLRGKMFRHALAAEGELSAMMASHSIAAGVHHAADRFAELLSSDKAETSRKVALALLHEGLAAARQEREAPPPTDEAGPWRLLKPVDGDDVSPDDSDDPED